MNVRSRHRLPHGQGLQVRRRLVLRVARRASVEGHRSHRSRQPPSHADASTHQVRTALSATSSLAARKAAPRKSEEVIHAVLAALEDERDQQARDALVVALGELRDRRAIPALAAPDSFAGDRWGHPIHRRAKSRAACAVSFRFVGRPRGRCDSLARRARQLVDVADCCLEANAIARDDPRQLAQIVQRSS